MTRHTHTLGLAEVLVSVAFALAGLTVGAALWALWRVQAALGGVAR